MTQKRVKPLPKSDNDEFWGDGEKQSNKPTSIFICEIHTKDRWLEGEYVDNKDGTVSCKECSWGARLAGYYRVKDGKIIDLRDVTRVKP